MDDVLWMMDGWMDRWTDDGWWINQEYIVTAAKRTVFWRNGQSVLFCLFSSMSTNWVTRTEQPIPPTGVKALILSLLFFILSSFHLYTWERWALHKISSPLLEGSFSTTVYPEKGRESIERIKICHHPHAKPLRLWCPVFLSEKKTMNESCYLGYVSFSLKWEILIGN